jgi:hypothetical protein
MFTTSQVNIHSALLASLVALTLAGATGCASTAALTATSSRAPRTASAPTPQAELDLAYRPLMNRREDADRKVAHEELRSPGMPRNSRASRVARAR